MKHLALIICLLLTLCVLPGLGSLLPASRAQTNASIRTINLVTNDLVYDPVSRKLYASVPSSAGANGNSITVIDPITLNVGPSIFVGSEPNRLALSDDGQFLYVGLDGAGAVRRVNLRTSTPEIQFTLGNDSFSGPLLAADMAVVPGCPETVVISRASSSSSFGTIAVYDNGVRRGPANPPESFGGAIAFGVSPNIVFAFGGSSSGDLRQLMITATGLRSLDNTGGLLTGTSAEIKMEGNLIFTPTGRVIDPVAKSILGTFSNVASALVEPDSARGRVLFLRPATDFPGSGNQTYRLLSYNQHTFLPSGSLDIPNVSGAPRSFVRFGANGVAFNVRASSLPFPSTPQIFVVTAPNLIGLPAGTVMASAASFHTGSQAAEAIATIFGTGLTGTTAIAEMLPLPTTLGGTTVTVKDNAGTERNAPLFFVAPNQINFLVPPGTIPGPATLTITGSSGVSVNSTAQITTIAPGIFTANADGAGVPAAVALRVTASNVQTVEAIAQLDAATERFVTRPIDLGPEMGASSDRVFLVMFGTGWRGRSELARVAARIGCDDAPISFAGAQGDLVGVDQVNLLIPRSQIGRGELDVVLTVDGLIANTVKINVK